ncbi:MAG TPA: LytTR family DNA-binding domain-containing protein [Longimicrobiaceae bacterium]|nr:LytTR family DNA-binding domain-containing protein [Longimicrobiaceae bacterium]
MGETRILVVVEDSRIRRQLRRVLKGEGATVVRESSTSSSAVKAIRREAFDVIFLDVLSLNGSSLEIVRKVGEEHPLAPVFLTPPDDYLLQMFEEHGFAYIFKPPAPEDTRAALRRSLDRARSWSCEERRRAFAALLAMLDEGPGRPEEKPAHRLARLLITIGGRTLFLRAADIDWMEAAGNYVRLHVGQRSCLIRETMASLEVKLDPEQFLRVHRSAIVNLDRVQELYPWSAGSYLIRLFDGTELRLSRRYQDRMQGEIGRYV